MMFGELIPCGGGDPIPLLKSRLLVGRRGSCDISLRFPNISSHHCEFEMIEGFWIVRDLGSRNGVKVNGIRCSSKWLMPGDVIAMAKHKYELSYTPTGDGSPPEEEDPFAIGLLEKAGLSSKHMESSEIAKYASDDDHRNRRYEIEDIENTEPAQKVRRNGRR